MRTLLEAKTERYQEFIEDIKKSLSNGNTETAWQLHNRLADQWYFTVGNNKVGNALRLAMIEAGALIWNHNHPDNPQCLKCGATMEGEIIRPTDEDEYTLWSCPECRDFEDF